MASQVINREPNEGPGTSDLWLSPFPPTRQPPSWAAPLDGCVAGAAFEVAARVPQMWPWEVLMGFLLGTYWGCGLFLRAA